MAHLSRERWPPNLDRSFPLCRHATMRWLCSERILISPDTTSHLGRERGVCEPELARGARPFQPGRSPSMPGFRAEVLGFAFPRQPPRRRHAAREVVSRSRNLFLLPSQPPAPTWEQFVFCESLDVYRRSPDSGEPRYKARGRGNRKSWLASTGTELGIRPSGFLLTHTISGVLSGPILTPDLD